MKAHIITIGDEILIGQIIDTNSAWMAQELNQIGAFVVEMQSVADTKEAIIQALKRAIKQADVILLTGGLGSTKDDVTKKTLADFFNTGFVFDQNTYNKISELFQRRGKTMTAAHREQCLMPQNAVLLSNKMGAAPGMWFQEQNRVFVSMPGVPHEMKYIMQHEVLPRLVEHFPKQPIAHRTILTVGEGESRLAARIEAFVNHLPQHIKIAYLPSIGSVRLRLTGTGTDEAALNAEMDTKTQQLSELIKEFVFGYDNERLEEVVGKQLKNQNKTLATAESCTGGYLAHRITSVSGSSAYFMGSLIAYSNEVKMKQLGVSKKTLEEFGAVSEQTVKEMVAGTLYSLQTDMAVATSGIAGPTGGTPDKPVGTIWLAVGNKDYTQTRKLQLGKNRLKNIEYSSVVALDMIRKFLNNGANISKTNKQFLK